MRTLVALVVVAVALLSNEVAHANNGQVGLMVMPMPAGDVSGDGGSTDLAFAFGLQAYADWDIMPHLSIGLAPQMIFNVKADGSTGDSANELDLMVRIVGHYHIMPNLRIYGYLAPGYSVVFTPSGDGPNPKGLMLQIAGGISFLIAPKIFINGQLGYQFGFQTADEAGESFDFHTNYFQIGLGVGTKFYGY